jgi:hypothetical protein
MKFFRLLILSAAFAASAGAFCGLQSCPRVRDPHSAPRPFEAGLRTRAVAFDIAGEEGYYGVVSPRFVARVRGLSLGVEAPWVTLHTDGIDASGLGNPLLMLQYAGRLSHAWSAEAGLQVELPFGDADHGLADDHVMALPWVGLRKEWGASWYTSGMLGYSQALEKRVHSEDESGGAHVASLAKRSHNGVDHGAPEETPVFVNPHGDREIHGRAGLGWRLNEGWTLEGFGLGQADVSEPDPVYYARLGVSAEWVLTSALALQALADAPVTAARRSEAALGVDMKIVW